MALLVNITRSRAEHLKKRIYKYEKANCPRIKQRIREKDWESILNLPTTQQQAKKWTIKFANIMDEKFQI